MPAFSAALEPHEPVGPALAAAGETAARAPWEADSQALDAALAGAYQPAVDRGAILVALGAYGRSELLAGDLAEVLLLAADGSADPASAHDAVRAHGLQPAVRALHAREVSQAARRDLDLLASLLDARLVAGDAAAYAALLDARARALSRRAGALHADAQRRYLEQVSAEPWQRWPVDISRGRGGLTTLQLVRLLEAPNSASTRELASERALLLEARASLDGAGLSPETARAVLLGMRRVDAAAAALAVVEPRWRRYARAVLDWQPFGAPPPSALSEGSDLDRLLGLLRTPGGTQLEPLPEAPWLERLLPEWADVRGLPHRDSMHAHPVDTHLRRTAEEARRAAADPADPTGASLVAGELANTNELLLAAILHGLGASRPEEADRAGALIAERFGARAGLDDETIRRLATVVEYHRVLATTAARRDIGDPGVIEEIAELAGDEQTLHLLYLLAIADARATSPDAWSTWRVALVRTLYLRVLESLEAGERHGASLFERRRDAALATLAGTLGTEAVRSHLDGLPARYTLVSSPAAIAQHIELISELLRGDRATALRHDPTDDFERLTIATRDRPGVLAAVAGTLAVHGVSVLGGNAYTRADGVAIDVLHVRDEGGQAIDGDRWRSLDHALPLAIAGTYPVAERLATALGQRSRAAASAIVTSVQVDNAASSEYSVVEVRTADRAGLLYAVAHVLHELALEIHLAKIDTLGGEVADAFYVLRTNGRRVETPDEIERVCRRVTEAIATLGS